MKPLGDQYLSVWCLRVMKDFVIKANDMSRQNAFFAASLEAGDGIAHFKY